jgi:GNAT superfamily N-acetyltransferase
VGVVTPAPSERPPFGTTVTLQVETPVGPIGVVGVLVDADQNTWSVRRRDGSVSEIDVTKITAARVVPPGRAARATVAEVQRTAALGWRALALEPLGDWLLRAGGGFTGRANSALALGDPGLPLEAAVDAVAQWYAGRDLPPRIQLVDRDGPAGLATLLDDRGWEASPDTLVMTAELGHVLRAAAADVEFELRLDDAPDEAWLASYRQDGGALPAAAEEVLRNHPSVVFASLRQGGEAIAIARASVDGRWAGLFGVEVVPEHRGQGLGAFVSGAALRWAGRRGARRTYLQVTADNSAAVRLYERLNYAVHHHYRYRQAPSG